MANLFRPTVTLKENNRVEIGRKLAFKNMFTVSDIDSDSTITQFRFRDNDLAAHSGFFLVDGVRQSAHVWHTLDANMMNRVLYSSSLRVGNESLSVQVFDGKFWSNVSTNQAFTIVPNLQRPTLTTSNTSVVSAETTQLGPLMQYSDPEGAPVSQYSVIDRTVGQGSGYFTLNGVRQAEGSFFTFDASRLGQLRYVGGANAGGENIGVRASDGRFFSKTADIRITTTANANAPQANSLSLNTGLNRRIPFRNLIRFTDADGNSLKKFEFKDTGESGGGFVSINGFEQPAGERIVVNANQLENTFYEAPGFDNSEVLEIRVFDGKFWSPVSESTITTFSRPILEAGENDLSVNHLEFVNIANFMQQTDPGFRFEKYQVYDQNDFFESGELWINNNTVELQQGEIVELSAAQFDTLNVRGAVADNGRAFDSYLVRGNNGRFWSDWERINVTTDPWGFESLEELVFDVDNDDIDEAWLQTRDPVTGTYNIEYSFVTTITTNDISPFYDPDLTIRPFDDAMKQDYREVFADLERFLNIRFREIPYTREGNAQMVLGRRTIDGAGNVLAFASIPPEQSDGRRLQPGDQWFDDVDFPFGNTPTGSGSLFRATALHELGHALSLKHPFAGNIQLPTQSNFSYNTVMTNSPGTDPAFHPQSPSNYMLYDILNLQEEYGANLNYNTGNDQYFYAVGDTALQAVHDAGGIDTINMGNQFLGGVIDIREGRRSSLNGQQNSLLVPYGVQIENARGTRSADTVIGNETKNLLFGNQGNDVLVGNGGNDVLRGGTQSDTYQFTIGDGRDIIREERSGGLDIVEYRDALGLLDSLEDDFTFRRLGRDLRIDFTIDQGSAQHTVVVKDMAWGGSRVEVLRLFQENGSQLGQDIELNSIFLQADSKARRFQVTDNEGTYGLLATPV